MVHICLQYLYTWAMSTRKTNDVEFRRPSLGRKIMAWVLIIALLGTTIISAVMIAIG